MVGQGERDSGAEPKPELPEERRTESPPSKSTQEVLAVELWGESRAARAQHRGRLRDGVQAAGGV